MDNATILILFGVAFEKASNDSHDIESAQDAVVNAFCRRWPHLQHEFLSFSGDDWYSHPEFNEIIAEVWN